MTETKGLSSITYNSETFLRAKFDELKERGWVEEWFAIKHKAEEDEKKDHWHVFWIPSGRHKNSDYREQFKEYTDAEGNPYEKPLAMMLVQNSVFGHWLLYSLHDQKYLTARAEIREHHYTNDDIIRSDDEVFERLSYTVGLHYEEYISLNKVNAQLCISQFEKGRLPYDVVYDGFAPAGAALTVQKLYDMYKNKLADDALIERIEAQRKVLLEKALYDMKGLEEASFLLKCNKDYEGLYQLVMRLKDMSQRSIEFNEENKQLKKENEKLKEELSRK